jgi:hypothetical protein
MKMLVDLRAKLPAARDQGPRPTCLAFAMSDAHALFRDTGELLSVDYLFYHAVQQMAVPDLGVGITLAEASTALRLHGQPIETQCSYEFLRPLHWKPPAAVGPVWRRDSVETHADPSSVRDVLAEERPAVLGIEITRAFIQPSPTHRVAYAHEATLGRHAVLAVGWGEDAGEDWCLVRNSWGFSWGEGGHAWLTCGYLSNHLLGTLVLPDEAEATHGDPRH